MKNIIAKILLVVVLAVATVPLMPVKNSDAAGIAVFDAIADAVRTLMHGMQAVDHAANVADRTGAVVAKTALIASDASCESLYASYQAANIVGSSTEAVTSTAMSVVGGGSGDLVTASTKLAAINTAIAGVEACIVAARTAVTGTPNVTAVATASLVRWTPIQAALSQSRDQLLRDLKASAKDIVKAFMVKTILTVSKNLTTDMVNKMVEKYKISDYLAYGDAVATQVYSMKYINDNFAGDARQQMMIRSMLQSEKFPEKIKTVQSFANSKAQEYLGSACGVGVPGVTAEDQNYFLRCLAAYGAPEANPRYHYYVAADQAKSTTAAANSTAQAEIAQGNGFAPPRNCSGSLAAQQQIDTQYDKATSEKNIAEAVVIRLRAALKATPPQTTQAELDKAIAAEAQAIANLEALTNSVNLDSEGKTSSSPIIDICEAIDTPANFVSDSIGKFLEKHLVQDTDLKTDNLPFYATFLSDVASNFLTNILTGGKSTSQVLKEAGVGALNGTLIGLNQTGGLPTNDTGIISAYIVPRGQTTKTTQLTPGQPYDLVVDISRVQSRMNTAPLRFSVVNDGGGLNLEDAISDADRTRGNFVLEFTANNSSGAFTINVFGRIAPDPNIRLATTVVNYSPARVAGVVTPVVPFAPRGPVAQFR